MKRFRKEKAMKRKIMVLGAVLAWAGAALAATYEGVQLWENGPEATVIDGRREVVPSVICYLYRV